MAYAHGVITDIVLMFLCGMSGFSAGMLSMFCVAWVVAVISDTN